MHVYNIIKPKPNQGDHHLQDNPDKLFELNFYFYFLVTIKLQPKQTQVVCLASLRLDFILPFPSRFPLFMLTIEQVIRKLSSDVFSKMINYHLN